ncbi:hypothetical protein DLAC_06763 [Tieghemostelium lacteum]|uniref:F-box domain-containing protein n=1 Tax=Tieghemostelium lacteum TaxID=361077 RepID=A0A151ZFR9_TIELA|nr:hypothetical protein DLAC_06763 [Tieghemostelium lacteum]|eukprot:KYQ92759.1 hypothetical protein DLAC_06763 [Tieghemostelium lacteum]
MSNSNNNSPNLAGEDIVCHQQVTQTSTTSSPILLNKKMSSFSSNNSTTSSNSTTTNNSLMIIEMSELDITSNQKLKSISTTPTTSYRNDSKNLMDKLNLSRFWKKFDKSQYNNKTVILDSKNKYISSQFNKRNSNHNNSSQEQQQSYLEWIPDEMLILIQSFLDPPSIGRISQVNRRFYQLSFDSQLWKTSILNWEEFSKRNIMLMAKKTIRKYQNHEYPFHNSGLECDLTKTVPSALSTNLVIGTPQQSSQSINNINNNISNSSEANSTSLLLNSNNIPTINEPNSIRSYYIDAFIRYRNLNNDRIEDIKWRRGLLRKGRNINNSTCFMFYSCLCRPYEWISLMSLIVFTLFLTLKLDNIIQWSWPIIFSPLFFLVFPFIFGPILFDFFRNYYGYSFENEFTPDHITKPLFFSLLFILPLQSGITFYRFLIN